MRRETRLRGIRGAIQVEENSKKEILNKTAELLQKIFSANHLEKEEIVAERLNSDLT